MERPQARAIYRKLQAGLNIACATEMQRLSLCLPTPRPWALQKGKGCLCRLGCGTVDPDIHKVADEGTRNRLPTGCKL